MLERLLAISASLGGLFYLLSLPGWIEGQNWAAIAVSGLLVLGLLALTLVKRLGYSVRSAGFVVLAWIASGFMLTAQGLTGSGRLLLMLVPLLAAVLFAKGRIGRIAALVVSILTLAVLGWLSVRGVLPAGENGVLGADWLLALLGFSLLASASTLVLDRYMRGLETSLKEKESTIQGFDRERQRLEFQLQQGTQDLEKRLVQIRTAAEITQAISKELDLDRLLPRVCELVKTRFDLYYVGVFLIYAGGDEAVLAAGTGEAGKAMLAEGHRLKIGGESMIGQATAFRQARIALDVGKDNPLMTLVRFENPHLPKTRSELALPLVVQQNTLGALTIQSEVEAAFDQDDIVVLQGIADGLANAIENARLFRQVQDNLEEISRLHNQYLRRSWMQVLASQGPQEGLYEAEPQITEGGDADTDMPTVRRPYTLDLPILLREQQIGSLTLESDHVFGEKELALIEAVINQAALALENARLLDETRQRADRETIAANISTQIWSSSDIDTILRTTLQELGVSLDAVQGSIELWPEQLAQPEATYRDDTLEGIL
jgi:GAF domain-containing protein